jgi:serine/threonine protein kinase
MYPNNKLLNNVVNRFLPIPESVLKGLEPEPKITDFTLIKELGVGSFGRVLLVQHNKTQAQYAIKAIDKRNTTNIQEKPYFRREIEIMYRIHHPNVVKLFGHFEDNTYCYFIMEYIQGGNIYSYVPKNGIRTISTQQVASIIKDVISATYFLHNMVPPIIHRDIKPENVLLASGMQAKLTDFGWSNYMQGDYKRTTVCGTPIYLAPEMINNTGHDEKVDIWCIGVLLFELMTGVQPWRGTDVNTVKMNIVRLKINWPKNMDRKAGDLISRILRYNPEERISLESMLMHPFFTQFFPNAISCLKRPDNTRYKVFIISKDHPLTWNPVYTNNRPMPVQPQLYNPYSTQTYTQNNYNNLLQKYDSLKKEYNQLRTAGFSTSTLVNLRRELKEKEDKINQLMIQGRGTGGLTQNNTWYNTSYNGNTLQTTYNDLVNENYDLKNKLNIYKTHFKTQSGPIFLDNDFNNIRNSITQNNKEQFSQAITQLRTNLDNVTQTNYNAIIMARNQEIEKWKQQERLREEREKQQFSQLIHRYDQTLTLGERENQKLKMRLKELQGYFV